MTWDEVRSLYPDQFVKFKIVDSHIEGNKEYVDEVAVIKAIKEVLKLLIMITPITPILYLLLLIIIILKVACECNF